MDVSIIIVNYNTTDHLKECLNSIRLHTKDIQYEIIVVDNFSPEREIEEFPAAFPEVKFFFSKENNGFGAGCNYGACNASGKYYVFLNPDIVLLENSLAQLYNFMEQHNSAAVCAPLMVNQEGNLIHSFSEFPGFKWEIAEAIGRGADAIFSNQLKREEVKGKEAFEVDWATGACLFIKSSVFNEASGFDENIFLYHEDVDLQYRIRKKGHKVVVLPYVKMRHYTNSSTRSDEGENVYLYHLHRNRMVYMYKHYGFFKRNAVRLMHIAGVFSRLVFLPLRGRFKEKRHKKYLQYKRMLELYFSSKEKVYKSKY